MKQSIIGITANPNEKNKNNVLNTPVFAEVHLDVPETLDEARSLYGEEVALSKINAAVRVDAQAFGRHRLERGVPVEDLQGYFDNVNFGNANAPVAPWKPGIAAERSGSAERKAKTVLSFFADMTEKEIAKWIISQRNKSEQSE